MDTAHSSARWGERGSNFPLKLKKFGQNQNISNSEKKLFGQEKVFQFKTIQNIEQIQLRFYIKIFFVVFTSFFRR